MRANDRSQELISLMPSDSGCVDFTALKSVNHSKLLHQFRAYKAKRDLWKLGHASQGGEMVPSSASLGSAPLSCSQIRSREGLEEEGSSASGCSGAASFALLLLTALRVVVFTLLL